MPLDNTDILRPSSAPIWTKCPAQPAMVKDHVKEQEPSDDAMEGTCAAWLAEMVLTGQAKSCREMVGQLCPDNNWPVDHIMANHIQGYCDMITMRGGTMEAERRVYLNSFINGTPDAYATCKNKNDRSQHLIVDDLKYGFGIVEPTSEQLTIYGGSLFQDMSKSGIEITHITLGIFQPRAVHHDGIYRTRTLTPDKLMSEVADIIEAGTKCFDEDPVAIPGRHCKYCPAAYHCPSNRTEMYDITSFMRLSNARDLTARELALQLDFIDLAEDVLKGLKRATHAEATERLSSERIPGWGLKRGWGRRKFTVNAQLIEMFTGINPSADSMCSPAELERRGADPEMLKAITKTPQTKAKLVPITKEDIAKAFGE